MPTNPDMIAYPGILGYVLIGITAFLLGGAVTALCILLHRRKTGRGNRP